MNPDEISKILYAAYKDAFPEHDRQCTSKLVKEWQSSKPFAGKKVLFNCHMTLSSLILFDALIRAGATVETTATSDLVVHKEPIRVLKEVGISFYENGDIPAEKCKDYYDIVYDCGAGLLNKVKPKVGMAELTHTNPALYQDAKFPVITVDNSNTKALETSYGTGNGFVQALMFRAKEVMDTYMQLYAAQSRQGEYNFFYLYNVMQNIQHYGRLFTERNYVLFGYGKVGQGIAAALVSAGVEKKNICIVDIDDTACTKAKKEGFAAVHLDETKQETLTEVKRYLSKAYCAVTATGCEGVISSMFEKSDFAGITFLANMGTPDEFGCKFSEDDILNKKKLFNFMLPAPTEMLYLDPPFTILLKAGQQLLKDKNLKCGLQNVSAKIDEAVLRSWHAYHHNTSWKHLEYRIKTEFDLQGIASDLAYVTLPSGKSLKKRKEPPTSTSSAATKPRVTSPSLFSPQTKHAPKTKEIPVLVTPVVPTSAVVPTSTELRPTVRFIR